MACAPGYHVHALVAFVLLVVQAPVLAFRGQADEAPGGAVTVVLIGGSGDGKSNLGNFLSCRDKLFVSSDDATSVTTELQIDQVPFFDNAAMGEIKIVDTPGLMDTRGQAIDKAQWDAVVQGLKTKVVNVHALVLVLNGAHSRFTPEKIATIVMLRKMFGTDFWRALRVVITRVKWSSQKQAHEAETRRKMFEEIEEMVVGLGNVAEDTKLLISNVRFFAVDMPPFLLDDGERQEHFDMQDLDDLEGYSLSKLMHIDIELQKKYAMHNVSSFGELKQKLGKKSLKKDLGDDVYEWGKNFGALNLGRLGELREDVLQVIEPLTLNVDKIKGEVRQIKLVAEDNSGIRLGDPTFFGLAVETSLREIREHAMNQFPIIKHAKTMPKPRDAGSHAIGWLEQDIIVMRNDMSLGTDDLLQQEAKIISELPPGENSHEFKVRVSWAYNSPPFMLDPELTRVCIEARDLRAAEDLVKDHVTNVAQLAFSNTDLDKQMPNTKRHGAVFQKVRELQKQSLKNLRESDDNKKEIAQRKKDRDDLIKEIEDVREKLQPYLDEVKKEADDRAEESEAARTVVADKVKQLLNEVSFRNVIEVPREVPAMATSASLVQFVDQIQNELKQTHENVDCDIKDVAELVLDSRVLKGMFVGLEPALKAQDMMQIVRPPRLEEILLPRTKATSFEHSTFNSANSQSRSKRVMEKAGRSFATSASTSGVGISSYGIGAFSLATIITGADEAEQERQEKGLTQSTSFYMVRDYKFPMKSLELDQNLLRLTAPIIERIVNIFKFDRKHWPEEIIKLFDAFGTHYCPSVELGGLWTQEAQFTEAKLYDESKLKKAMAKCFDWELKTSGAVYTTAGFGSLSGAGTQKSCGANSSAEATETNEMMKSTMVSHWSFSGAQTPSTSQKAFESSLKCNGNWNVIDRHMGKCVSLWDALYSQDEHDVMDAIAPFLPDGANVAQTIQDFREAAEKIWNLHVLKLPRLCKGLKRKLDEDARVQCDKVEQAKEQNLDGVKMSTIRELWENMQSKVQDVSFFNHECMNLDFCNGKGSCEMNIIEGTTIPQMRCACRPTYTGSKCEKKIEEIECMQEKKNDCTAHPIMWYQDDCSIHGEGFKGGVDPIFGPGRWEHCAATFGGRLICKKFWKCQPRKPEENCCQPNGKRKEK